jgi:hypothetical protein
VNLRAHKAGLRGTLRSLEMKEVIRGKPKSERGEE